MLQIGTVSISIYYGHSLASDIYFFHDIVTGAYNSAYNYVSNLSFETHPMHPSTAKIYDMYMAMQSTGLNTAHLFHKYTTELPFSCFSPLRFYKDLLFFHINLDNISVLKKTLSLFTTSLGLILAVNIHRIIAH